MISYDHTLTSEHQTIVQLLEAEDEQLTNNIRSSPILISSIRQLAKSPPPSRAGGAPRRDPNDPSAGSSDDEFEDGLTDQEGEGEIVSLARRILDLTEVGEGDEFGERGGRNVPVSSHGQASGQGQTSNVGSMGSEHAALRASVHRALSGGGR